MSKKLTRKEIESVAYYVTNGFPYLGGDYEFKLDEKADSDQPVAWLDGWDVTQAEFHEILLGRQIIQDLKANMNAVLQEIHPYYREETRAYLDLDLWFSKSDLPYDEPDKITFEWKFEEFFGGKTLNGYCVAKYKERGNIKLMLIRDGEHISSFEMRADEFGAMMRGFDESLDPLGWLLKRKFEIMI